MIGCFIVCEALFPASCFLFPASCFLNNKKCITPQNNPILLKTAKEKKKK